MNRLLTVDGARISYAREGDNLVVTVSVHMDVERHLIPIERVQDEMSHVEVLVMNELAKSKLLARKSG